MNGDFVHRLGAAVAMVLVAGRLARGLGTARRGRALRRRLRGLLAPQPAPIRSAGRRAEALSTLRPWLPLAGTVGAGWALVGGAVGVLVGLMGAAALWRWSARRSAAGTEAAQVAAAQAARQLPLAADLLAACIAAGASPVAAARAVGEALGGPVGDALGRGAAEVRLGGEPAGAWRGWPPSRGPCRWRGCWSGPRCPACPRRARSPAWPPRSVPTGPAPRRSGPVERPSWSPRRWGCAFCPRSSRWAYCRWSSDWPAGCWVAGEAVADGSGRRTSSSRATDEQAGNGIEPYGVAMYQMVRARVGALVGGVLGAVRRRAARRDAGMVTSEYAMGIVAAVAFAVVLYKVVTSGTVSAELQGIVKGALDARM